MQLGIFLKRFRKEVSISGNSLAKRIGVKRHSLEKWENTGSIPNYESSLKIQSYFGIGTLFEISEEDLFRCIENELNRVPACSQIDITTLDRNDLSENVFEQLKMLNMRIKRLEEIAKDQSEKIEELKKSTSRTFI